MSQHMLTALGQTLAQVRNEHGVTQTDVAGQALVNHQLPTQWENGHVWPEDPDVLAYSELTRVPLVDIWMRAAVLCAEIAATQRANDVAVRGPRRTRRLQSRSRRSSPSIGTQAEDA